VSTWLAGIMQGERKVLGGIAPYVIASEAKQSPVPGVEIASSLRGSQ
jgi:hypothetical protein